MTRRIFICGGGTGGHFFCGLAFAERYLETNPQSEVHFVGVRHGIEGRYRLSDSRMKIHFVAASGFKNMGALDKFHSILSLIAGVFQSMALILKWKPWLVMGVGGYSSIPGVFAARILSLVKKMRVVVVDQNSSPGLANKVFSRLGAEAYSAFPYKSFECIELPLRSKVEENMKNLQPIQWPPKHILVMGGSQGAQGLNQAWMACLEKLYEDYPDVRITHQTGKQGYSFVKAAYENLKVKAEVFEFSDELAKYMTSADLVVTRAGALSLFELMAYQRACILVPFPQAADNHQFKNAEAVQKHTWILPQHQVNWANIKEILEYPEPQALAWKLGPRTTWRKIFRPLK